MAARRLDAIRIEFRTNREANADNESVEAKFGYALPLINSSPELRESFFESLETLVDRHVSTLVHVKGLEVFLELCAIEYTLQGDTSLGMTALSTLGTIMKSSRNLDKIFVTTCVADPFVPILANMSLEYLVGALKEILSWCVFTAFPQEMATALGEVDAVRKVLQVYQFLLPRAQAWWEKGSESYAEWKSHRDNNALNCCSELIAFMCQSEFTANRFHPALSIVLYTKLEVFVNRVKSIYLTPPVANRDVPYWLYPPLKLIGVLATKSAAAAEFFAGPEWSKRIPAEWLRLYKEHKAVRYAGRGGAARDAAQRNCCLFFSLFFSPCVRA